MNYRVCLAVVSFLIVPRVAFPQSLLVAEKMFPQLQPILVSAVQQSPRMIERNLDLEAAAGDAISARAALYPQVSSYARILYASEKREDISGRLNSDKLYYDISVNQSLFHWGDIRSRAKMGEIREKITQKLYAQGYTILAQEIRAAYLRLIVQKVQLEAAKFALQNAEQALNVARERQRNRQISDSDVFTAQINFQQTQLGADRAQDSFNETKRQFALLTGSPAPSDDSIPTVLPRMMSPEGEVSQLLARFLGQPEPKTLATEMLKSQMEIERLNYSISRHGLRPKLNLVVGISQDEQSYTTNLAAKYGLNSRYVGLSASWSIFDGFATKGAVRGSLARVRKLETSYKQLTDNLGTEAQRAARQLGFTERQMQIQDQLAGSAENFLTFRKEEFARKNVSETDVATAQMAYNRELINALQQRSEYLLQASAFIAIVMDDPVLSNLPAHLR
jgi:outer membrane protein TolC